MRRSISTLFFAALLATACCINSYAQKLVVSSPDKSIVGAFETDKAGHLVYSVKLKNKVVLNPSMIGIIVDGVDLGQNAKMGKAKWSKFNGTYATIGVHSKAINQYNEAIVPVAGGSSKTVWILEVRAFNDSITYRYRVPGAGTRKIDGEASDWQLPSGCTMWFQDNRRKEYESPFRVANPDTIKRPMQIMTTATFKLPENMGYAKITEANLINYSDMALVTSGGAKFKSLFHNNLDGWQITGEIVSPWRVVMMVDNLNALVNTDVFQNLCPAPEKQLVNADWIKPGRSTWHWMVTGSPQFEDQSKWIDWTKQLNFEYYIIDDGWIKWKKEGLDQWDCMKEVTEYAKKQGVKIWAWTHSKELFTPEQRADYFAKAKAAGITGLKIDFMKPADLVWVNWYDDCLRDAAQYKLMINFHGAVKPSGRERTWPNELTREGIRGREMGKQPALHDISLIFTRFVQGHADYTPTDFRPEKLKGSTWSHELAMAVTFTSPLFCFSGRPEDYIASEAYEFFKTLPTTWDETIVLPGSEIGDLAAIARRKGKDWYIGVLNGNKFDKISIDLKFIGAGIYNLEKFEDVSDKNDAWIHSKSEATAKSVLSIGLSKDGGAVIKLTPKSL
jgi:alpha-glucosidase